MLDKTETLGTVLPNYIGVTLNYSPKFMFKVNKKSISWGRMTPDQQVALLDDHISKIYRHHFEEMIYRFELTKDNNIHLHGCGLLNINPDHRDYHLTMIRKLVAQHPEVIRYTKGKSGFIVTSNYIHYVDKDKWLTYIDKDKNKLPYHIRNISSFIAETQK